MVSSDHEAGKKKSKDLKETDLYQPIKAFLQGQGYTVKAEIQDCDVVGVRGDEAPVIIELKTGLTIALLLQGVDRQAITDAVYIAMPRGKGKAFLARAKDARKLCLRLGLGLISVRLPDGTIEVHCDPAPYQPRKIAKRKVALLKEFQKRVGDPNTGGQVGRMVMTAYRQDVLRILNFIALNGPSRPRDVAAALAIVKAPSVLSIDYYGWFYRVERGVYDLSDVGQQAVVENHEFIKTL
tara:strand:- start:1534 stop:2250 length:717 start_codon:yes stop_codon:yes gene_type:complete